MARFYAMSWIYGRATTTTNRRGYPHGEEIVRAANYYSFPTRAARDRFCEGGSSYRTERDYREALSARDAELRRAIARDAEDEEHISEPRRHGSGCRVPYAERLDADPAYSPRIELDAKRALGSP